MARTLLKRLLREERGFTLVEQLVVASGMAVILAAILGLSEVAIKQAPQDRERVHAARDAEVAVEKMNRELRTAHTIDVESFKVTATIYRSGAMLTIVYDCSAAPVNGLRTCIRTQSGSGPSTSTTAIQRVANSTSRPVFTATQLADRNGVLRTTYVRTRVEVPSRGELSTGANARIQLDDGFYLRNADARR